MSKNSSFLKGRFGSPGFATARQIFDVVDYGDYNTFGMSKDEALEFKFKEAAQPNEWFDKNPEDLTNLGFSGGLLDSIKRNGFMSNQPVHIATHEVGGKNYGPNIIEGHHRVAVMYKLHPDQPIPIRVWKTADEMMEHFNTHGDLEGI